MTIVKTATPQTYAAALAVQTNDPMNATVPASLTGSAIENDAVVVTPMASLKRNAPPLGRHTSTRYAREGPFQSMTWSRATARQLLMDP